MFDYLKSLDYHQLAFAILLVIFIGAIVRSLKSRNSDPHSKINLDELLLDENEKTSKVAAVLFGAFALSTWVIIKLTLMGQLTEGYYAAYLGAWVAPTVARIIKGPTSAAAS